MQVRMTWSMQPAELRALGKLLGRRGGRRATRQQVRQWLAATVASALTHAVRDADLPADDPNQAVMPFAERRGPKLVKAGAEEAGAVSHG